MSHRPLFFALLSMLLAAGSAALADESAPGSDSQSRAEPEWNIPEIMVIGSKENVNALTGSGYFADVEEIQSQGYDDINRILRRAPGVSIREEDGYGLFPNISLRGVDSQRNNKVTIMEDGVPTAPATYAAPSAYYTPTAGRMHAVEVLKGTSQIRFGPHTTGGVINYISTPVPEGFRTHGWVGSDFNTGAGRMGYLIEGYFRRTDGFKRIDSTASLPGSDGTGFRRIDPSLKLFWEPDTEKYSRWELKVAGTDLDADETYLGLTDSDLSAKSNRRYAASRFDNIDTNQLRTYLRYTQALSEDFTVTTTGYYNRFRRNWFKLRGDGEDLVTETANGCWLGTSACTLDYRANRRNYYSTGLDINADWLTQTGSLDHNIQFGVRYHQDRIQRRQRNVEFQQDATGAITSRDADDDCSGGGSACRYQKAQAVSAYVQDRIDIGRLTLQPGVRFESVRGTVNKGPRDEDFTSQPDKNARVSAWSPGISGRIQLNDAVSVFGGVHRGVFIPGPNSLEKGIDVETSLGYEFGGRLVTGPFSGEITLFYTDFDDLLVVDNIGSGGAGDDENVGDVNAYGVEISAGVDAAEVFDWPFRNPWNLSVTLTEAELDGDSESTDNESIFSGGSDGNDVPYIPNYTVNLGTGIETEAFSLFLDANWVDSSYSTASNTTDPTDLNVGETDDYILLDLSGRVKVTENTALTFNIYNLADEEYIVSRHPIGPRAGLRRMFLVGAELGF